VAKRHKLSKSSLHWFVKSRPFVLVPEIRRRFELDSEDEAYPIQSPGGRAFVALPQRAARLLEDLVKEHRVGLELAPDLGARLVLGVFAFDMLKQPVGQVQMRPPGPPQEMEPSDEDEDEAAEEVGEPSGGAGREPSGGGGPPPGARPGIAANGAPPGPRRDEGRGRAFRRPERADRPARPDRADRPDRPDRPRFGGPRPTSAPPPRAGDQPRRGERPDLPRPRPEGPRPPRPDRPRPRPS